MSHIPDSVSRAVERFGDSAALICSDGEMGFTALHMRAEQCKRTLVARGIAPGQRVAAFLPNSPEFIAVILGAIRAGVTLCPLSTRLPTDEVAPRCRELDAQFLVSDTEISEIDTVHPFDLFDSEITEPPPLNLNLPSEQPAVAIFTSGSTSRPKAALLSYGNLFYNAILSNENIDVGPGNTWLLSLPLYHVGGLGVVFRCLLDGGRIAVPEADESIPEAIHLYGVTHVSLVATQLYRLMRDNVDLSGLKAVLLGGGPVPEGLVREALERGIPIHTSYGMTETASQITTTAPNDDPTHLLSSGKVLYKDSVAIDDSGEIVVAGDTLFLGYLRDGEIDRPLDRLGRFHTGDLGRFSPDGYLHVTGRRDNMFISGGENIQPEEIESALLTLDGVAEAVVVPREDPEFGHRPIAFVRIETDSSLKPDEIRECLLRRLSKFKVPERIEAWPADMEAGMKISRPEFRARAAEL